MLKFGSNNELSQADAWLFEVGKCGKWALVDRGGILVDRRAKLVDRSRKLIDRGGILVDKRTELCLLQNKSTEVCEEFVQNLTA